MPAHKIRRLQQYTNNMIDYRQIMDLMPTLAQLFFVGRLTANLKPLHMVGCLSIGCLFIAVVVVMSPIVQWINLRRESVYGMYTVVELVVCYCGGGWGVVRGVVYGADASVVHASGSGQLQENPHVAGPWLFPG